MTDFLFLFEHTGYAAEPFTRRGFHTTIIDILNTGPNPRASVSLNLNILKHEDEIVEIAKSARFVFGMPPCTDLTVSGNRHTRAKYKANPNFLNEAAHLFMSVKRIADKAGVPYCIENPIGIMSSRWRKPNKIINPSDYGGYLPEDDVHPEYPQYIKPRDAYPKKTCLWASDDFEFPEEKPVPVLPGYSTQHTKLGGKSARTKLIRSASPRGFFEALAQVYCK